jgi:hypothetical protein
MRHETIRLDKQGAQVRFGQIRHCLRQAAEVTDIAEGLAVAADLEGCSAQSHYFLQASHLRHTRSSCQRREGTVLNILR